MTRDIGIGPGKKTAKIGYVTYCQLFILILLAKVIAPYLRVIPKRSTPTSIRFKTLGHHARTARQVRRSFSRIRSPYALLPAVGNGRHAYDPMDPPAGPRHHGPSHHGRCHACKIDAKKPGKPLYLTPTTLDELH